MKFQTCLLAATIAGSSAVVSCGTLLGTDSDPVVSPPRADADADEGATPSSDAGDAALEDVRDTGIVDAAPDVFDAGCGAAVAIDFSSPVLPGQVTESNDPGSSLAYDLSGVGGTRAMHVTVPGGGTNAGLVINVQQLGHDGAKACAVSCGFDIKLVQRGTIGTELVMAGPNGTAFVRLSHDAAFTYFSRSGAGEEAPNLGTLGLGAFTHVEVLANPAPLMAKALVGSNTDTKTVTFFPVSARIGVEKVGSDVSTVEAIIDNVLCRSRLP